MQKNHPTECEFKSLLTENEYKRLMGHFSNAKFDFQTNHYFDTKRFSLKAVNASLRVRERDELSMTYKRKKGYNNDVTTVLVTKAEFEDLKNTGELKNEEVYNEISGIIKDQKLINFLSLSTLRAFVPYASGILNIDKSEYLGIVDYELEFATKSYHLGKSDFIKILGEFGIQYKKSDKKIKRAFNALKNMDE